MHDTEDRIGNRPLDTDSILPLAIEIADALDAGAFRSDHSPDIKPATFRHQAWSR